MQGKRTLEMPTFEINERLEWLRLSFFSKYPEFKDEEELITSDSTPELLEYLTFVDWMRQRLKETYLEILLGLRNLFSVKAEERSAV